MYLSYLLIDTTADPSHPRPGRAWLRNPYRIHQRLCMAFPSAARKERDNQFLDPFLPAEFVTLVRKEVRHDGKTHVHHVREEGAGFLFRIDMMNAPVRVNVEQAKEWRNGGRLPAPSRHVVVVQSAIEPNWTYAFNNAREFLCAEPLVKKFTPIFEKGQKHRFRLRANPTKKVGTASKTERIAAREANIKLAGRHGRRVFLHDPAEQEAWLREQGEGSPPQRTSKGFTILDVCAEPESPARARKGDDQITLAAVRFEGVLTVTDPDKFKNTLFSGIGSGKGFGFGLLSVAPA